MVFKTARGQGGDGCEELTSQLHTCLEVKVIEEIRDFLEWGGWNLGWDHQVKGWGFGGRGFDTCGCFLFQLPSSWFSGRCGFFGLRLLRLGSLPDSGHFRLLRRLHDRLRTGIWISGWSGGGGPDTPPSDEVQPLTQVHLLGRGPRTLSFRSS